MRSKIQKKAEIAHLFGLAMISLIIVHGKCHQLEPTTKPLLYHRLLLLYPLLASTLIMSKSRRERERERERERV